MQHEAIKNNFGNIIISYFDKNPVDPFLNWGRILFWWLLVIFVVLVVFWFELVSLEIRIDRMDHASEMN